MDDQEVDILQELAEEARIIPKGKYPATIKSAELKSTSRNTPYIWVRLETSIGRTIYVTQFVPYGLVPLMKLLLPKMEGIQVDLNVKHQTIDSQTFVDAKII